MEFDSIMVWLRMCQGILALLFNSVTILTIKRFKFLQTSSNVLVASLAFSDMLHGLVVLFLNPVLHYLSPGLGYVLLCYTSLGFEAVLIIAQFTVFALISIERFKSLKATVGQGSKWGLRKSFMAVGFSWSVGLAYFCVVMGFKKNPSYADPCNIGAYSQPISSYVGSIYFIFTTVTTLVFYLRIAHIFLNRNVQVSGNMITSLQAECRKSEFKIAKMLAMVVGLFFILYIPFVALIPFMNSDSPPVIIDFHSFTLILMDVNFWINPVIYAWRSTDFRKAFLLLLKSLTKSRRPEKNLRSSTPAVITLITAPQTQDVQKNET